MKTFKAVVTNVYVRDALVLGLGLAVMLMLPDTASASGLDQLDKGLRWAKDSLIGGAKMLAPILLIAGGFTWALNRQEEGTKKIGQALVGLSVAIGGAALASTIFGDGGAAF